MSQLGQTEKRGRSPERSAMPSITDIISQSCQVRKVPTTDSCTAARRSCFRLRFRGGGRRHGAM